MLLVDGKTVVPRTFCAENGLDYDKIMGNPVFELDKKWQKKDKANGGVIKIPAKVSYPSRCFIKLKNGATVEMRYAENRNFRTIKNERIEIFTPKYISLDTVKTSAKERDDLAVYMYANPIQGSSPFGNGKNPEYHHLDPTSIAKTRMDAMSSVSKAMALIEGMDESELVVLAKGIKASFKQFNPFVDGENTHTDILRVEMMQFSQLNAPAFLELIDNKMAKTKGQIINLIDNRVVAIHTTMNTRQWRWEKGENMGNMIGDQIVDPHADATDYLVNYILSHLAEYYSALHTVSNGLSSEEKALDFLKNQKESEYVPEIHVEGLPKDFKETMTWLGENGFRKMPALAKQVNNGIQDGTLHNGNIHGMVKEMDRAMSSDD